MLSKLFKKRNLEIFAPVNGEIISLDQVPDPVFSQKMMGEGVAIMPTNGHIHAPVDGTVVLISDTKHAIALRTTDGTELLIHIGLETVSLQGKGFKVLVETGDQVSLGQSLIEVDWVYIGEHAKSIITPIIITNSSDKNVQCVHANDGIMGKTLLMTVSNK
ncbi:PTS glucose transporter subunit IIA [Sporosarcina sp. YIM B06819]|uniref:PTS sugar transporter subunit IIA n=1 Tax=Sporosarcina sp. YIM B06819 TaxID=3081769 RepID=UPI00298C1E27|nr:PTS glucose transporter subunit IIA [Sporosarcina sp. YIM B06819]